MENPLAPQVRPKRLEFLDGLRGLAALAVFLAHFGVFFFTWDKASGFDPYRALAAVKDQLLNGAFAVYVFFALSGFVIAQSAASGRRALPSRLLARYLRLTIPMTVSLIWGWCLLVLFAKTRLQMDHSALRDLYRAYFLVQAPSFLEPLKAGFYGAYLHGTSALNPVVWTMRVELLGSCAVYVFYRFCPETWRVRGLCLVVLLNTLAGGHAYLGFSLGALIREAWIGHHLRDNPLSWLAVTVCFLISADGSLLLGKAAHHFFNAVGGALLVYAIATLPLLRRLLATPFPEFLGRISFSLYLVHLPVCALALKDLELHLPWPRAERVVVLFIVYCAISFPLAWLMTVLVDEPLLRRLRFLTRSRQPDTSGKAPASPPSPLVPATVAMPADSATPRRPD